MLGAMDDDVASAMCSTFGGGSDDIGSGLVESKDKGSSKQIGSLGITLSGSLVVGDKDLIWVLSFG